MTVPARQERGKAGHGAIASGICAAKPIWHTVTALACNGDNHSAWMR